MALPLMAWAALAGAGKGILDAQANRQKQKEMDKFRQASIRYSPWTGLGDPGHMSAGNTSFLSGALGGGLQGATIGAMGQQAGLWGKAAGAQAPSSLMMSDTAPQYLQGNPTTTQGLYQQMHGMNPFAVKPA